ncbi:MAG: DUF4133 domain-containing protein [Paludibacteraceae bacterium]|nr:DUF4133 domain-containing protein [Paludibacteraceae bacterium]
MEYAINKGVNRPLDFYGLKETYIFYFVGGILCAIVAYFILQFISNWVAIPVALVIAILSYVVTYYLNNKFGANGLSKRMAQNACPKRVQMKRVSGLLRKGGVDR